MKWLFGTTLLVICSTLAVAESRGRICKSEEQVQANLQLKAIAANSNRRITLLEKHLPFGIHESRHAAEGGPTKEKLLIQAGYVTLHDGDLRTALWTAHKLTRDDVISGERKDKVKCFRGDERLPPEERAREDDYESSDYDRGHLTADRDLRDNLTEQVNSYIMSNMSPQHGSFNGGIWLSLENLGREWAKKFETVYITSGALFDFNLDRARDKDNEIPKIHEKGRVAIPSHYYKVFLRKNEIGSGWFSITFLLKHEDRKSHEGVKMRLKKAIVRLEDVEEYAEATFHPDLDRDDIDEGTDWGAWCLPQQYGEVASACESKNGRR